jgi:UDP-2-acetamido-2,6-beta-L-arabino-hexul-4-ose reductase
MSVTHDSLNVHSDTRGFVFEPLDVEIFAHLRNAHVVVSSPGVVRGNHYHLKGEETIAVIGPALVRYRQDDDLRDVEVPPEKVYRFAFPPGVPHAIQNLSRQPNALVAFNTVAHDPQRPDTVPFELIGEEK